MQQRNEDEHPIGPAWVPEPDAPQPRKHERALRRHHRARRLAAVTQQERRPFGVTDPVTLRVRIDTRTLCSCSACRNGHRFRVERKDETHALGMREQVSEALAERTQAE